MPLTPVAPHELGAAVGAGGGLASGSGREYTVAPDGSMLLLSLPRFGRELQVVLHFDQVIRRKMAEGNDGPRRSPERP